MQTEHLLNERSAAERLGVAPKTLARWRFAKRGPVYRKIGGLVKYAESDLVNFIAQSAVPAQDATT